jgi:hypothetical protein
MKKRILYILMYSIITYPVLSQNNNKPIITTGSLFKEMMDMKRLGSYPDPTFRTIQFSSYDHRSTSPNGADWFANSDGFGGEPIPNFQKVLREPDDDGVGCYLLADVKGPGAVVRLWTAAISGKVKVIIDGADKPIINGEAEKFFHRPYDFFTEIKHLNKKRFETTIYQRDASYTPIPFAKHLRVEWTGNIKEIHFYQLEVRLYQEGTQLVSFSPADISTHKDTINQVTLILSDPENNLKMGPLDPEHFFQASLKAQETKEVFSIEGSHVVKRMALKLKANNMEKALRQTVLHIQCDGHKWGQVQSPVGDFFGAAPGINPYQSLPFAVKPDGTMVCRYVMPFRNSLKIHLQNLGDQQVDITGNLYSKAQQWTERSLHFYARWRVDHNLIASGDQVVDLPFLIAAGKGVYVGTTSYLLNPCMVPTPWGNWWGEGDEKVFIDNETNPSIFGTGSEDYYNYSWSSPDIFYFPYCGQPRNDGPGNRGFVTNYRWHILDPIPFLQGIRFYMELFHHERTPGLSYARIGYYYARPGVTDDHVPIMPEDVRFLQLPKGWTPVSKKGAKNSVFFTAEEIVIKKKNIILEKGNLWEGGQLMCWHPEGEGDSITFKFNVDTHGKKRIHLTLALTPSSGEIRVLMDSIPMVLEKDLKSINLFRPHRTLLRNFILPTCELSRGEHTLTIEFLGINKEIKAPKIGVDFIWIRSFPKEKD